MGAGRLLAVAGVATAMLLSPAAANASTCVAQYLCPIGSESLDPAVDGAVAVTDSLCDQVGQRDVGDGADLLILSLCRKYPTTEPHSIYFYVYTSGAGIGSYQHPAGGVPPAITKGLAGTTSQEGSPPQINSIVETTH
jgi:hypothetical protein